MMTINTAANANVNAGPFAPYIHGATNDMPTAATRSPLACRPCAALARPCGATFAMSDCDAGLEIAQARGMEYNPFTKRYWLSDDTSVNYMFATRKAA